MAHGWCRAASLTRPGCRPHLAALPSASELGRLLLKWSADKTAHALLAILQQATPRGCVYRLLTCLQRALSYWTSPLPRQGPGQGPVPGPGAAGRRTAPPDAPPSGRIRGGKPSSPDLHGSHSGRMQGQRPGLPGNRLPLLESVETAPSLHQSPKQSGVPGAALGSSLGAGGLTPTLLPSPTLNPGTRCRALLR